MQKPICLYDSGIGGLTVLKKMLLKFPNEHYIYFSDLAHVPFGDKTETEIKTIANSIIEWLSTFSPKLLIMACNTSSAILKDEISETSSKLNIPIYGMIQSISEEMARLNCKKVSVWATNLATKSGAYKSTIQKYNSDIKIEEIACPKLVPVIEDLSSSQEMKKIIIQEYLDKTSKDTEGIIWGCTHYPLIENEFKKLSSLKTFDPANSLIEEISRCHVINNGKHQLQAYSTANTEKLEKFAKLYLCSDLTVRSVTLKLPVAS